MERKELSDDGDQSKRESEDSESFTRAEVYTKMN